jgi:hypothetical protein
MKLRANAALSLKGRRELCRRVVERRVEAIAALRRLRFTGPEISESLGMALSRVSAALALRAPAARGAYPHDSGSPRSQGVV